MLMSIKKIKTQNSHKWHNWDNFRVSALFAQIIRMSVFPLHNNSFYSHSFQQGHCTKQECPAPVSVLNRGSCSARLLLCGALSVPCSAVCNPRLSTQQACALSPIYHFSIPFLGPTKIYMSCLILAISVWFLFLYLSTWLSHWSRGYVTKQPCYSF